MTAPGWNRLVLGRPLAAAVFLAAGLLLSIPESPPLPQRWVWTAGLWLLGLPLLYRTLRGMLQGRFAADLVAGLAVVTDGEILANNTDDGPQAGVWGWLWPNLGINVYRDGAMIERMTPLASPHSGRFRRTSTPDLRA